MKKQKLKTPYYLIDENKLLKNLKKIRYVQKYAGTKFVLALKCFSSWCVFNLMKKFLDGTTSSSLYEARLGYEKFGKETHAYCVGFKEEEILEVKNFADKIIFNSVSQLNRFYDKVKDKPIEIGIRVNPGISYSCFDLADPARKYSRLGVVNKFDLLKILSKISGVMFHFNCENEDYENFSSNLDFIERKYGDILRRLRWISFGGGLYFTKDNYPIEKFARKLKNFSKKFALQVYLEPGEAVITQIAYLVTTVVDIVKNEIDIAIVDASTEAHMLDLLIYRTPAKMENVGGSYRYQIAGRSCLAGDIFGTYGFKKKLKVGSIIKIADAAGYSIVKKNWFNGLQMPSIVVKRLNGKFEVVKEFGYEDFVNSLS